MKPQGFDIYPSQTFRKLKNNEEYIVCIEEHSLNVENKFYDKFLNLLLILSGDVALAKQTFN